MAELAQRNCVPIAAASRPLEKTRALEFNKQLSGWTVSGDSKWLSKEFKFSDFSDALRFTNEIGALAEQEKHHPDIILSYGRVAIELTTHSIGGLSENDFILAAKIDALTKGR